VSRRCCCDNCQCECNHCVDNRAPCCIRVDISGIGSFTLRQDSNNNCRWSSRCTNYICGAEEVSVSISNDAGNYIVTVRLGDHVWEKNYGSSKPYCCQWKNEKIPHSVNGTSCDSSSSTCTISVSGICALGCCSVDNSPDAILCVINGLVNGECRYCTCLNGKSIIAIINRNQSQEITECSWDGHVDYCGYCGPQSDSAFLNVQLLPMIGDNGRPFIRVRVEWLENMIIWQKDYYDDVNPFSWDDVHTIPLFSDFSDPFCDGTNSTVTISAAHGGASTYAEIKRNIACSNDCGFVSPSSLRVDISNVIKSPFFPCNDCCEAFNQTFILEDINLSDIFYLCEPLYGTGIINMNYAMSYFQWNLKILFGGSGGNGSISATLSSSMYGSNAIYVTYVKNIPVAQDCNTLDITLTRDNITVSNLSYFEDLYCSLENIIIRIRSI